MLSLTPWYDDTNEGKLTKALAQELRLNWSAFTASQDSNPLTSGGFRYLANAPGVDDWAANQHGADLFPAVPVTANTNSVGHYLDDGRRGCL